MKSNSIFKAYLKSKTFFAIMTISTVLITTVVFLHNKEIDQAKELYKFQTNAKVMEVANTLSEKFKASYETLRTVSLLPGVRSIEKAGEVLGSDTKGSIQQLYNNTFLNIRLSEIYVLPKDFDFKKINPITKKPEEPLAIFDELIAENPSKDNANETASSSNSAVAEENTLEEVEEFEYSLHKEQLAYFAQNFSTKK